MYILVITSIFFFSEICWRRSEW